MQLPVISIAVLFLGVAQAWTVTVHDSADGCSHGPNALSRRIVGRTDDCFNFGDKMDPTDCYQFKWDPKHPQVPAGPAGCMDEEGGKTLEPAIASYYDRMRRGTKCYFYSQRDCVRSPLGNHECPANIAFMKDVKIKSFKCVTP